MADSHQLGRLGETLAAEFLLKKGYKIITRNLRSRLGEIDILAQDGEVLVLVEVKSQTRALVDPIYQVSPAKQRKLWLLARQVAAQYPNCNIRIDAVTLHWKQDPPEISHYLNIL